MKTQDGTGSTSEAVTLAEKNNPQIETSVDIKRKKMERVPQTIIQTRKGKIRTKNSTPTHQKF